MQNTLPGKDGLVIAMSAMNRTAFDFVGRFLSLDNGCLVLKNPLVLEYDDKSVLQRLSPLHLPYGMVDVINQENVLSLPLEALAYWIELPENGSDWMHREYELFFQRGAR